MRTSNPERQRFGTTKSRWAVTAGYLAVFVFGAAAAAAVLLAADSIWERPLVKPQAAQTKAPSLGDLLAKSPAQLQQADLAETDLLCAADLRENQQVDVGECLGRLRQWSKRVADRLGERSSEFARNSKKYPSEASFKLKVMEEVLKDEFSLRLDEKQTVRANFSDPANVFIHGVLEGKATATANTLPVLYACVGRRAGMPLRLGFRRGKLVLLWEDPLNKTIEAFDDDGHGLAAMESNASPSRPASAPARKTSPVRPLGNLEEIALVLSWRGRCLLTSGNIPEAQVWFANAHRLSPGDPTYVAMMGDLVRMENPSFAQDSGPTGQPGVPGMPGPFAGPSAGGHGGGFSMPDPMGTRAPSPFPQTPAPPRPGAWPGE